ncbi:uncharacterized protein LOC107738669 [Sinocyclocheilus rhinocerous]|uniref:uncharacterized protein LOC107738669 n=1 Tax=Sinocyclocheilus rhinocerous TaxID=307959 RepID=UPI0007B7A095|nr:PREDICTED: uncharacterized protein LOC107738669 [Sinocyclocheilus rhinocerous]
MKLTNTKPILLFTLILLFHTVQAEASHDEALRILVVGIRGQSRFSAADLLSGRKDGGQEDREIVKTPVITDEARRMMLVTGPNLCEEDTARQTFTTALFLSSPGPHAVLMLLNLEDQQSQQCDIVKRAQELLGAEVLQYCIVLLLQNHQERFTGASRGIAGEMINACGGRFHIIRDSEAKPAQRAALIVEIDKLVHLNEHRFYSVLTQDLETEEPIQDVHGENPVLSLIYDTLGGTAGIVGWIFLVSLTAFVIYTEGKDIISISGAAFTVLVLFMVYLRNIMSPDLSIPLNLSLLSSLATVLTVDPTVIDKFEFNRMSQDNRFIITDILIYCVRLLILPHAIMMCFMFMVGSALIFGTIIIIRTWSDVLIACYAAPGVTVGAFAFSCCNKIISRKLSIHALGSFLCCTIGATLSVGFVNVFGGMITIILLISGLTMMYFHLNNEMLKIVFWLTILTLLFSCACVLIGSVILSADKPKQFSDHVAVVI